MSPKILVFDIETAPITVYTWSLWDQNVGLNQIKHDWHLLAWAAKWLGDPASKVMYMDNRRAKNIRDDKALIQGLIRLLEQADIVVTQNGDKFDCKKLNARAIINKLAPIRPYRSTDILKEGKKVFSFTSHKLAYVTSVLNTKYKKLDHKEYPGFDLWEAVLRGEKRAWEVMEKYTRYDVLSTEEAYMRVQGWIKTQNLPAYDADSVMRCACGSKHIRRKGYAFTDKGKYQIYWCLDCGKWPRGTDNLLSKAKRGSLLRGGK